MLFRVHDSRTSILRPDQILNKKDEGIIRRSTGTNFAPQDAVQDRSFLYQCRMMSWEYHPRARRPDVIVDDLKTGSRRYRHRGLKRWGLL